MLKHVIDIGWTSVCPSVRLSVTRWYCIKTAEYIVMFSSPHDSPFILVLCISRSSRNSDGVTPSGPLNRGRVWKYRNFRPITCYISKTVESTVDGYILRGVWQALNSHSIHVTFTAIVPGARTQGRPKCAKYVLKWRIFRLQAWITGKRLKIDGYIQRDVLQALNPLSNRVTFTAIVPGATPYKGVKCKGVGKSCDFRPISRYSS